MTLSAAFESEPAFVPYLVAGDPGYEASLDYVEALARGGADVVELGLPFSEPIAEGPTIQEAIVRSLEAGMTPDRYFSFVEDLDVDVPLVCMTYYNLVYQYGAGESAESPDARGESAESPDARDESAEAPDGRSESGEAPGATGPRAFVQRAATAGIEGLVVPDLPPEEAGPLRAACDEFGLDLVFIVAPTTTGERLERMRQHTSGYVYVQARLGTTGARDDVSDRTAESLSRVAEWDVPKAVGFGIKTGDHAERIVAAGADGVIVGSALVDIVASGVGADTPHETVVSTIESKASELKSGAVAGSRATQQPPEQN